MTFSTGDSFGYQFISSSSLRGDSLGYQFIAGFSLLGIP